MGWHVNASTIDAGIDGLWKMGGGIRSAQRILRTIVGGESTARSTAFLDLVEDLRGLRTKADAAVAGVEELTTLWTKARKLSPSAKPTHEAMRAPITAFRDAAVGALAIADDAPTSGPLSSVYIESLRSALDDLAVRAADFEESGDLLRRELTRLSDSEKINDVTLNSTRFLYTGRFDEETLLGTPVRLENGTVTIDGSVGQGTDIRIST